MRLSTSPTLVDAVLRPSEGGRAWSAILRDVLLILAFSWMTAALARLAFYLPFSPVPITGQAFGALITGAALGSRRGGLSMLAYLAQGAAGLPVFAAGNSGVAYMMGPTGGYLLGFVVAAFVVGWLAEQGWDRQYAALAMLAGSAMIYVFGLPRLAFYLWGLDRLPSDFVPAVNKVLVAGLYPFVPGDLVKIVLAAIALPSAWALVRRFRG